MAVRNLIFILGDQVSRSISSLDGADPAKDHILMAEVSDEASYVPHHKKKIAFVFSAMRHFAEKLREEGFEVSYLDLTETAGEGSFGAVLERVSKRVKPQRIILTQPSEWRVRAMLDAWRDGLGIPVECRTDDRFISTRPEFAEWAAGRKQLRMEYFYRDMRKKTGLLMDDGKPEGGKWNYDADNRKPASADLFMPSPAGFEPDQITKEVLELVSDRFASNFGDLTPFWFAVTAEQAETAFDHFLKEALPRFGDYQDAMLKGEKFLYHAVISMYLNAGLLSPLAVCRKAETAYHDGKAPLNAVEGFIRQIIGWREYVRGIYWLKMPGYVDENFLDSHRPLPAFYWTGDTDMLCVAEAVAQTRQEAYAHHIQRLMVTGNFALLAGIAPKQVHEWYLSVYADAFEWVELPNTLGMSQFADGGLLASKPYASGGNYIQKMSDYCRSCHYDVKIKTGPGACPFNSLYWNFLERNRDKLDGNARLAQIYRTWDRMSDDKKNEYRKTAETYLTQLEDNQRL